MCFVLACWAILSVSLIALSLSHSNYTCLNLIPKSLKVALIEHNNYWLKCTPLRRLKVLHYFASLMTKIQVIFPIVDICSMYSFSQLCIPHNWCLNIQSTQILLLWDTTIQHFVYASSTSIFSWLPSNDSLCEAWNLAHIYTLNITSGLDEVT